MTKFALRALPVALLTLTASLARADQIPNNTVRIGEYWVFYHVSADDISGPYVPPGLNLDVGNVHTPYFAYLRRLSTHFTAELAFGIPPLTKTYGRGPATVGSIPYNGQEISTARWFAPTALIEYVFFDESHRLRPYIGVGVNYTKLYDRDSTAAGNALSGGPTSLSLPVSVGVAGTAGVSYRLPHNWSVMASYSASQVRSRLTADTAGVLRTTEISFGPQTLVIAAGFSF
ncbi:MAG: OmpW/AlkL family protein [Steroidobacteraceae bacterium]|jgi:outer membrane protein